MKQPVFTFKKGPEMEEAIKEGRLYLSINGAFSTFEVYQVDEDTYAAYDEGCEPELDSYLLEVSKDRITSIVAVNAFSEYDAKTLVAENFNVPTSKAFCVEQPISTRGIRRIFGVESVTVRTK